MMLLVVQNKADGKTYEISELVSSISFSDSLNNGCSKLDFTYLHSGTVFENGSIVMFKYGGVNIFFGYIFSYERGEDDGIDVVAYDQLRYLKAKDSFNIEDVRLDQVISKIAGDFKLRAGRLEDTGYVLPKTAVDNQTYLDVIYDGISATLLGAGRKYAFYDSFGSLMLTDLAKMWLPVVIGEESLAYGYKYGQSIDDNTYNLVMIKKKTDVEGEFIPFKEPNAESIARYGLLQYFETAESNANSEQLREKARALLRLLNRETKSLSLDAIGVPEVRAGNSLFVNLPNLDIPKLVIVSSCKHSFETNKHTMSLELIL